MKERPILFSGEMVRAILDGRKTQTRRVFKTAMAYVIQHEGSWYASGTPEYDEHWSAVRHCPYGQPGDKLWVRETWAEQYYTYGMENTPSSRIIFRADAVNMESSKGWIPSIFMPRWASRIMLKVTGVRVERVQDISEADIEAEGFDRVRYRGYTSCKIDDSEDFSDAWDHINGKRPGCAWNDNPWVWVVEFQKV